MTGPGDGGAPEGSSGVIEALVRRHGPVTIADYMMLALWHPQAGYYARGASIGAGGDFITAPEYASVFGDLLAAWIIDTWQRAGAADELSLVELGPGRSTLMADVLTRLQQLAPALAAALPVVLVEGSAPLRRHQQLTLAPLAPGGLRWLDRVEHLPDALTGPVMVLANEFLDALPIRQFIRHGEGWHERLVAWDDVGGVLSFAMAPRPSPLARWLQVPPGPIPQGTIAELCPAAEGVLLVVADLLRARGGTALLIDYGPDAPTVGDTLQALRAHQSQPPLQAPGAADLTAHVDFCALTRQAQDLRLTVHGPVPQGTFLKRLGFSARLSGASPTAQAAAQPLVDPVQMGTLFKVLGLTAAADGFAPPALLAGFAP